MIIDSKSIFKIFDFKYSVTFSTALGLNGSAQECSSSMLLSVLSEEIWDG